MGLYDGYKLDNSSYISQYVGSIVPELRDFSNVMQKRYNDARDTDDSLVEAMGNLQHLGTEEDTTYANELKQNYMSRLLDRSEREDYENMGRRTQRDARAFGSDYAPLVNRMKGMQAIQTRVNQDDKIFSPETKAKILGRITKMNSAPRDSKGEFIRDASGKVQLGAIEDWAYAKDVDINKKLADFLKAKEADMVQSGFRADGRGLMTSTKRETRSAAELGRLAKEMMETDPEIKAMIERDVELNTYNYSPGQMTSAANKANISLYDRLKRDGLSENMIKSNLKGNGISLEVAKLKPVDVLRQDFIAKGRTPQEADAAFVKNQVRKDLMSPHIDLVSQLLKVDRSTLEAREDPVFAARATAAAITAAMAPQRSGEASPLIVTPDNGETGIDVVQIHNTAVSAMKTSEEMKGNLQAAVGSYLGLPKPNGKNTADWYNTTGKYINDKNAQGQLIAQLKGSGKTQEADNLTQAFREYNRVNNTAVYAKQQADNISKLVNVDALYNSYVTEAKKVNEKVVPLSEFRKSITGPTEVSFKSILGANEYTRKEDGLVNRFLGRDEKFAMRIARDKYFRELQQKATEHGKTIQTSNTTFEPTAAGYLKNQTDFVENGLKEGTVRGVDMATGESFADILTKELGSGWFGKSISASDKSDPNSAYNKALRQMTVRINMDTRGANGEPTATVKTPNGQIRTIILENISRNLPTEMSARMMDNSGKYMTRGEMTTHMQAAAKGAGLSELSNINQADLYQLTPSAKPYQLNDLYYLKVGDAGIDRVGNKASTYTLMVKDGDTYKSTNIKNRTSIDDILISIGGQKMKEETRTQGAMSVF